MNNEPLVPYLKLCQVINQSETEVFYQEDCDGNVVVNKFPAYPLVLSCEVIDFVSEDEFNIRGKTNSFEAVDVTLEAYAAGKSIRQAVYEQLLATHPTLVI